MSEADRAPSTPRSTAERRRRHRPPARARGEPLLEISGLKKHFPLTQGIVFKKTIGHVHAVDGVDLDPAPRRDARPGRRVRLRQVDGVQAAGRAGEADRRARSSTRAGTSPRWTGGALKQYRREVQIIFQDPYALAEPADDRRRHRRRGLVGARRHRAPQGPAASAPRSCWTASGSTPTTSTATRTSSPAASASASASPAPWRCSRRSSSATSRCRRSTCRCRRRWSTCSRTCRTTSACPTSSSPTTCRSSATSPTASR